MGLTVDEHTEHWQAQEEQVATVESDISAILAQIEAHECGGGARDLDWLVRAKTALSFKRSELKNARRLAAYHRTCAKHAAKKENVKAEKEKTRMAAEKKAERACHHRQMVAAKKFVHDRYGDGALSDMMDALRAVTTGAEQAQNEEVGNPDDT